MSRMTIPSCSFSMELMASSVAEELWLIRGDTWLFNRVDLERTNDVGLLAGVSTPSYKSPDADPALWLEVDLRCC